MLEKKILSLPFDAISKQDLLLRIKEDISLNKKIFIVTANTESVMLAERDKKFLGSVESADVVTADGAGILWAASFLEPGATRTVLRYVTVPLRAILSLFYFLFNPKYGRMILPERIAGADLFWDLSWIAEKDHRSIFLLGGYDKVAERTAKILKEKYPDIDIAGIWEGNPQDKTIVKRINDSGADMLFVAWGQPKQENWIAENFEKIDVKLAIGLGGTFDFVAGKRKRAPKWLQKVGLEWLWRFIIEPKRIGRIFVAVPKFVYAVIRYKIENPNGSKN